MKRRRSRRAPLIKATAMSLAAVVAAVAAVRARRRRLVGATASDLSTRPESAFPEVGVDASPVTDAAGRDKETATPATA